MTKYKVELTDSQRQYILGLLLVDEHKLEEILEQSGVKQALAFTKRVKKLFVDAKS